MTPEDIVDLLADQDLRPKQAGAGWVARCPSHEDRMPSLSIGEGDEGRVLLKCFAGCSVEDICSGLGIEATDLFVEKARGPEIVDVYPYTDEAGGVLYEVVRFEPKDFRNRRPDGAGGWNWSTKGVERVPYRLPEVIEAVANGVPVWFCEGEKDVARALKEVPGVCPTTAGGVSQWKAAWAPRWFQNANVTIVADNDAPGLELADRMVKDLKGIARTVRVLVPATGKDLSDHFDAGKTANQFVDASPKASALDVDDFLAVPDAEFSWIVPNLWEAGDRVIWTGEEGGGKSTMLRQIALRVAAGLHPFTDEEIEPVKVLYIDVENSPRQVRRKLRPLREKIGDALRPGMLMIKVEPASFDLVSDPEPFMAIVEDHAPQLIITGPAYKLHVEGDAREEGPAKAIAAVFDDLRSRFDCALILEAHSPYPSGGGPRPTRPYGASVWSRWPEFGVHIAPDGKFTHWRGQRDERDWPSGFRRGREGEWPWIPSLRQPDGEFKPTGLMDKVSRILDRAQLPMTRTELKEASPNEWTGRAIDHLIAEGFAVERDGRLMSLKPYVDEQKGFK